MSATPLLGPAMRIRNAGPADAEALLDLHNTGFGPQWNMARWRWRFLDNPLRRTDIKGAFTAEGRCLAAFCGVPLPCLYAGEAGVAHAAGDVIVHPQLRRSAAGATLLLRVATEFFRTFGGGPVRMVFGFPEPALCRVITRHCGVELLSDVPVLVRAVDAAGAASEPRGTTTRSEAVLPGDVDELARHWHAAVTSAVVRDGRYLRWRYAHAAHEGYRFVSLRHASGRLQGLAILRPAPEQPDATLLVEWLLPRADAAAAPDLLAGCAQLARSWSRPNLVVAFAGSSPEFAGFQREHGFHVVVSEHRFVFRSYHHALDRRFLFQNWFHSLGDLDCT